MASFDPEETKDHAGSNLSPSIIKYPMKRLELSVRKFIKVLDIDLDRLYKHTENIRKLTNAEDWTGLHREQVNASRTIQQINANIREIEKARNQVKDEDLHLFDSKVEDVKRKALSSMEEFMNLIGPGAACVNHRDKTQLKRPSVETGHGRDTTQCAPSGMPSMPRLEKAASLPSGHVHLDDDAPKSEDHDNSGPAYGSLSVAMTTFTPAPVTSRLHVAPQDTDASNSWEQLQENIVELNELVHHFATQVDHQGEMINTIEDNIETAHSNVHEGATALALASKYKSGLLPVVGAVVGGVLGGPIGFVAGMKMAGLAGLVGGAAGYTGGRMLKKRQEDINAVELENLSDKRAISLTDTDNDASAPSVPGETQRVGEEEKSRKASTSHGVEPATDSQVTGYGITNFYSSMSSSVMSLFSKSEEK